MGRAYKIHNLPDKKRIDLAMSDMAKDSDNLYLALWKSSYQANPEFGAVTVGEYKKQTYNKRKYFDGKMQDIASSFVFWAKKYGAKHPHSDKLRYWIMTQICRPELPNGVVHIQSSNQLKVAEFQALDTMHDNNRANLEALFLFWFPYFYRVFPEARGKNDD